MSDKADGRKKNVIHNTDGTISFLVVEFDKPNEHGEIITKATVIQKPIKPLKVTYTSEFLND